MITFTITIDNPQECYTGLNIVPYLPLGNDATLDPCQVCPFSDIFFTDAMKTYTFSWTPTLDDAGTYSVLSRLHGSPFLGDPCGIWNRYYPPERTVIVVADAGGQPQFGSVSGHVTADCPGSGTPLYGVAVDVIEMGTGNSLGSTATDETGAYTIPDLPVGDCTVNILVPLGYTATSSSSSVEVLADQDVTADFALGCQAIVPAARTIGFWKHQFVVANGGHGSAQIDGATLCSYLDLIEGHFNDNAVNSVAIYIPPQSGECDDKLFMGGALLNLQGSVDMVDRARQQLLALLLNVASAKVALFDTASEDGATISQAITYCDNVIDDPLGDYENAKTIADTINNGKLVPAGMIPLATANIAYRARTLLQFAAGPSPAFGSRTFRFAMARGGKVALRVFDVRGRLVSRVFEGSLDAGGHALRWDGRATDGTSLSSGVYFARLSVGKESLEAKLVQTKR